jgi:apolipoprotein D and lipocalin family protein
MNRTVPKLRTGLLAILLGLAGCGGSGLPPLRTVPQLDLARFMGDWYVIANIPTALEAGAHNAVETYRLDSDGTIATTFTFRDGGFDGPRKRYEPTGFVLDPASKAIWGMQFVWPIKSDFRIIYLSDDYGQTIVAREARDYVWIMARKPEIPEADFKVLADFVKSQGYDVSKLQKVPQRW